MVKSGKMSREDRAKQFMPFAALKGYEEALREKERIIVKRIILSEDKKDELDKKFQMLEKTDIVSVVYFSNDEYIKKTGMISKIDLTAGYLRVVNDRIDFDDICDMIFENKKGVDTGV